MTTEAPSDRLGPPGAGVTQVLLDGRYCVFSPTAQQVMVLNDAASSVWALVDGTRTVDEVVDVLAAHFDLAASDIGDDVRAAVRSFVDSGLISPVDGL